MTSLFVTLAVVSCRGKGGSIHQLFKLFMSLHGGSEVGRRAPFAADVLSDVELLDAFIGPQEEAQEPRDFLGVTARLIERDLFDELVHWHVSAHVDPLGDAVWAAVVASDGEELLAMELADELAEVKDPVPDRDVFIQQVVVPEIFLTEEISGL